MDSLLKSLRLEKGWSQEQLAGIVGISVRTVQRLENGGACSLETAKALAAVFGTKPELFLGIDEGPDSPEQEDQRLKQLRLERKVRQRLGFYKHLAAYLLVNFMLLVINLLTSPGHLWFFYPLLGWGIGIAFHAMATFRPSLEENMVRRMMEKEAGKASAKE